MLAGTQAVTVAAGRVKVHLGRNLGLLQSEVVEQRALHADAVVLSEAEDLWPQVLADFKAKALKPIYKGPLPDLGGKPMLVPAELKPLYHAACVISSSHLVVLLNALGELSRSARIAALAFSLAAAVSMATGLERKDSMKACWRTWLDSGLPASC